MNGIEDSFYSAIYAAVSEEAFLNTIIGSSRSLIREKLQRDLNVFDSAMMADSVIAMLFEEKIMLFLRTFNFPVVDFSALREGIRLIIKKRLIEEAIGVPVTH